MPAGTVIALAAALFLWASAFAAIRVGVADIDPGTLAMLSMITMSVVFVVIGVALVQWRRGQPSGPERACNTMDENDDPWLFSDAGRLQ